MTKESQIIASKLPFLRFSSIPEHQLMMSQSSGKNFNIFPKAAADISLSQSQNDLSAVTTTSNEVAKMIVLHPGSRNLQLGLVKDGIPKTIPHVIARKPKNDVSSITTENPMLILESRFADNNGIDRKSNNPLSEDSVKQMLSFRQKCLKRKPMPNLQSQVRFIHVHFCLFVYFRFPHGMNHFQDQRK